MSQNSIPQIVSNLKMYLNFDASDAQAIVTRLYQGSTQIFRFPTPKPGEDKVAVMKSLGSEKLAKEFGDCYDLLENQNNPQLMSAVFLLKRLFSSHTDIRLYMEFRTQLFIQRVNKIPPRYMSSKSIANPARPIPEHIQPSTPDDHGRSLSLPRGHRRHHTPVEIKTSEDTVDPMSEQRDYSDQRKDPRDTHNTMEHKRDPRDTRDIIDHKRDPRDTRDIIDHKRDPRDTHNTMEHKRDPTPRDTHDIIDHKKDPRDTHNTMEHKRDPTPRDTHDIIDHKRDPRDTHNTMEHKRDPTPRDTHDIIDHKKDLRDTRDTMEHKRDPTPRDTHDIIDHKRDPRDTHNTMEHKRDPTPRDTRDIIEHKRDPTPRDTHDIIDHKKDLRDTRDIIEHKRDPRDTHDTMEHKRDPRDTRDIMEHKRIRDTMEHMRDQRDTRNVLDHRREPKENRSTPEQMRDPRDNRKTPEHIREPRDTFEQSRDVSTQRRDQRDTLEVPKQSKAPIRQIPSPELPGRHLTRNYINVTPEIMMRNPPPPMRETDLFSQEQLIVEEIISLLVGIQGWYIQYDSEKKVLEYFQGGDYINHSLKSLIRKIEPIFCYYSTVTKFIELNSTYEHGLVSQSLCSVMSTLLKEHYTIAAQLETQLRSGNLSIQQLWFYLQPCFKTLNLLFEICGEIDKSNLQGAAILSMLHDKISTFIGDPKAKQWCLALATHTSLPYFEILENWIYRGVILDPKQEFMVEESKTTPNPALQSHPYYDLTTQYWDRTYTWKEKKTPGFFRNLHEKILKTGKYLNVFRESEKKLNNPNRINIRYSENPRDYIEPIDLAFKFASEKLLKELSDDHDLMGRLNALRRYFLMNQGDFFLHFMAIARPELFGKADDIQLQRLQSLLEMAIANSNARYDKYADYLKVKLETSDVVDMLALVIRIDKQIPDKRIKSDAFEILPIQGEFPAEIDLTGLEAFNLEFEVKWPVSLVISTKVMTYYQLLFRQLFYFKHVETSLNEAWIRQKNMKQYQMIGQVPAYTNALVLRQQMISYVQNFQFYMMYEVVQLNWKVFKAKYDKAITVDDVMQGHMDFLEKCVNDFLMHHHGIIRIVWKILACCIQFTNYLNKIASDFNQKFQLFIKSNDVRIAYRDAAGKNVLRTLLEGELDNTIKRQQNTFNSMLEDFIDKVSRLTQDTDPDHKTNSLIVRLKFYTRTNPNFV